MRRLFANYKTPYKAMTFFLIKNFRLMQTCLSSPSYCQIHCELFSDGQTYIRSARCTRPSSWSFWLNDLSVQASHLLRCPLLLHSAPLKWPKTPAPGTGYKSVLQVTWCSSYQIIFPIYNLARDARNLCSDDLGFECMWHLNYPVWMLLQASTNRWWPDFIALPALSRQNL